ncbi:uncharacterized protein EV422DRAFT_535660 [Fimicolochytrium jonesii]|uniref:uncharacterized protein n=1 Tax=Fimicolochytrium jonesii TaxID=1396493 RepID=UPI0022FEAA5F|nr:uncharacterized protein EV422DRAFT_535660 [Fimicolochytrium jonesii]KAI8819238.1 hypothetical protein EV422DRAFT_535660 [Fimicolochytrium jonesii]
MGGGEYSPHNDDGGLFMPYAPVQPLKSSTDVSGTDTSSSSIAVQRSTLGPSAAPPRDKSNNNRCSSAPTRLLPKRTFPMASWTHPPPETRSKVPNVRTIWRAGEGVDKPAAAITTTAANNTAAAALPVAMTNPRGRTRSDPVFGHLLGNTPPGRHHHHHTRGGDGHGEEEERRSSDDEDRQGGAGGGGGGAVHRHHHSTHQHAHPHGPPPQPRNRPIAEEEDEDLAGLMVEEQPEQQEKEEGAPRAWWRTWFD